MKKFKVLEHTADLKIQVFGKTKEELFFHCLEAMGESQKAEPKGQEIIKRKIKIQSSDLSSLLVDFLSEALYLSQVNKEVYFKAEFERFSDTQIEGEIIGREIERFGEDIKGVTYHDLDIRQKPKRSEGWRRTNVLRPKDGTWQATILFDI